jgi:predicted nucleotidyltransferase
MSHQKNIVRIKAVANALENLKTKIVFVGGATNSLYPERLVFEVRPTDDIDVIIGILSYSDRVELEKKLRKIGFTHDVESGVVCRYKIQGIIVDIMPTHDPSIGFSNIWYPKGFEKAVDYEIEPGNIIKILSPPYFIATKLEAHKGRGEDDGRTSQDFEDIVFILENRASIWDEINSTDEDLKSYLKNEFKILLKNPNLFEWIDCHVERGSPPATYDIMEKIEKFVF